MKNKRAANRDHVEYKLVKILKVQHANNRPREETTHQDEAVVEEHRKVIPLRSMEA